MPEFAKDDHFVATLIAGAAVMLVLSGFLLQKLGVFNPNQKNKVEEGLTWSDDDATIFVPPAERQEFIDAKAEAIKNKPVTEEVMQALKKKLMRRTFKQIPLVHELQQQGPSADKLYKKGMITDALHNRYKDMKQYFDVEFPEVQGEAEALAPGWGQQIWVQANQLYQNIKRQEQEEHAKSTVAQEDEQLTASFEIPVPEAAAGKPVEGKKQVGKGAGGARKQ